MPVINRRSFLTGLTAVLAAPAIIRTPGVLMRVRPAPTVIRPIAINYDILYEKIAVVDAINDLKFDFSPGAVNRGPRVITWLQHSRLSLPA